MKANNFNVINRLFGTMGIVLKIPVYQRNYDWTETNVRRLLDDLKTVVQTKKSHFIGAIVYLESQNSDMGMQEFLIIDGQQRITTLSILIKAVMDLCGPNDQQAADMSKDFLTNKYLPAKYRNRLKPIKSDNQQYEALLNNDLETMNHRGHIYLNYQVAKKTFASWIKSGIKPLEILNALGQLQVVGINFDKEDDPQVIFESINSTGVALTNSDLIRNFLLMDDYNQDQLFDTYWIPIESLLRRNNSNNDLDQFFRQYLITKKNSTITERKVYFEFVDLFKKQRFTHENALQELRTYASFLYPDGAKYFERT